MLTREDKQIVDCVVNLLNEMRKYGDMPDIQSTTPTGIDPVAWSKVYGPLVNMSIKNLLSLSHPH